MPETGERGEDKLERQEPILFFVNEKVITFFRYIVLSGFLICLING